MGFCETKKGTTKKGTVPFLSLETILHHPLALVAGFFNVW